MRALLVWTLAFGLSSCAIVRMGRPTVSVLVDLDPASTDQTLIVQSVIACDPFSEVVRLRRTDINPEKPGLAETFATGTEGANGIAFDRQGSLYVAGAGTGQIYRVGPRGGPAELALQIGVYSRTLPDGKTQQLIVANGVAFDAKVQEIAKNGSQGPLEFPSAIVFVGNTATITNNNTPRRDNLDANGNTALDGIGASIVQITS